MNARRSAALVLWIALAVTVTRAAESRIPITGSTTISTPGTYYVARDITAFTDIILVNGAAATIDLNGHTITATGGIGIQALNNASVVITNGRIVTTGVGIQYSGSGSLDVANVTISAGGSAIYSEFAKRITVTGSTLVGSDGLVVVIGGGSQARVLRNTVSATARGILFNGSGSMSGAEIADNVVASGSDVGISVVGGAVGATIRDNTVTAASSTGIYVGGQGGHLVDRNVVRGASVKGIDVPTNNNRISNNVVTGCGSNGIDVGGSYNVIDLDQSNYNSGYGVSLTGSANVYRSNVARNDGAGQYNPGTGNTDAGGNY